MRTTADDESTVIAQAQAELGFFIGWFVLKETQDATFRMSQDLAVIHYNGHITKNRLTGRVSVTRGDHYEAVSLTTLRKHGTGASDDSSSSSTRDATSAQTDTRLKRKMTGSGRSDSSSSKRVFKRVMTEKDEGEKHGLKRSRPGMLIPDTISIISVRMNYLSLRNNENRKLLDHPKKAYISRYALGRDYHKVLRKKLNLLGKSYINGTFAKILYAYLSPS